MSEKLKHIYAEKKQNIAECPISLDKSPRACYNDSTRRYFDNNKIKGERK
jgi:hypothetical protein